MKYLFYVILYVAGILIIFQGTEKIITSISESISENETKFMLFSYLLASMISFLSIIIITIKKISKK